MIVVDNLDIANEEVAETYRLNRTKSMNPLSFRKATELDCDLYFEWVNDSLVREHSFNSNYIGKTQHTNVRIRHGE